MQPKGQAGTLFQEFFIESPLYAKRESVVLSWADRPPFIDSLLASEGSVDCFCPKCGKESVFSTESQELSVVAPNVAYVRYFTCNRKPCDQQLTFVLLYGIEEKTKELGGSKCKFITKIGQYPSFTSLSEGTASQYRTTLGTERLAEYRTGIALAAHDTAVAAFVYFRRVFEGLIEDAHKEAQKTKTWDEKSYKGKRIDEKIQLLEHYLPQFLVGNRSIYGILSKGVHELTQDECAAHLDIVKLGIELILDAVLEKEQQTHKQKQLSEHIGGIAAKLKDTE